ncbi:hypothetical protein FQZ97_639200 [compost metagenome]
MPLQLLQAFQGQEPGLFQFGLAGLQARLLGQQVPQFVLACHLVEGGIAQAGFHLAQLLMQFAQVLFQLLGFALVRGQLLTQRGGRLALGALVGLVRVHRRTRRRRLARTEIHQPTGVVVEVAIEGLHTAVGHQQELVGGALEQVAVVGHHQHGAGEILQGHGQGQAHFQVEVVGGFVQQQQVGLLPGDQRQGQARLLAPGEIGHLLVAAIATEVEATEEVAQGLFAFRRSDALQVQQWAGLGIEGIQLMLGEVADGQVLAARQAPTERRQVAGKGLDQRRLARAVGAEQADARTRSQLQLDLLEHRLLAVAEAAFGEVQQRAGYLVGLAEAEVEGRVHMGRRQFFEALQGLDPALCLAGLGGLRLEAGDVLLHVRTLGLLLLVSLLLLRQAFGAGALEGRVAAPVERQLLLLQVSDVVHHRVEEVAVVGDQQQGARIALEPLFEPEDGVEVEVVGGLVEQQQLGRTHQCLGQVQAHPPSAGEVANAAVHLLRAEAEASQQLACAGVGRVAIGAVQFDVQAGDGGAVVARFGGGQVALYPAQVQIAVEHVVHGQALQVVHFLAHVGDAPVRGQQAVAGVRPQFATQQGEQAGFAGAIGADEADFLAGVQGQFSAF